MSTAAPSTYRCHAPLRLTCDRDEAAGACTSCGEASGATAAALKELRK